MSTSCFVVLIAMLHLSVAAPLPQFIDVFPRREINDLMTFPRFAKQRDLLVLSLRKAMDMNPDNPMSFYQIASIHGMPALPYNNVTNKTSPYNATTSNRWMGYCEHGKFVGCWHASMLRDTFIPSDFRPKFQPLPHDRQQLIPGMAQAICSPLGDLHHWSCQANRKKVPSPPPGCLYLRC